MKKAEDEYRKYQAKTLSPVEKNYLDTIMALEQKIAKKKWQSMNTLKIMARGSVHE